MAANDILGASDLSASARGRDVRGLLDLFQARLWLFLTILGLVMGATVVAAFVIPQKYTATASLKVDPSHRSAIASGQSNGDAPDTSLVDTEASVLKSREVAAEVVKTLHLTDDGELGPKGKDADNPDRNIEITIDHLLSAVSVTREGATYIIDVKVITRDPAKSARIANALVRAYIDFSNRSRSTAAEDQTKALNQRLGSLGQEVQSADAQVAQYRATTGTVSGSGNTGTVTEQQIPTVAAQLALAQAQAASLRSKAEAARSQMNSGNSEAVSQVLDSSVITDLRRQRTEVIREQAQIMAKYGPKHPDYVRVAGQLTQLDKQIADETTRILSGLQSDARAAEAQSGSLAQNLASLKARQSADSQTAVKADSLQRDADAKRTIFNQISQAAQESAQLAQIGDSQTRVVASASPPAKASFPNKPLFAALGFVIGFVAGAAAVFLADALDPNVQSLEDVEGKLGLTFLSATPFLPRGKVRETGENAQPWDFPVSKPLSGFAESFRTVRALLLNAKSEHQSKVVLITSALPAEGKTVSSVSLARVMALSGDRTLIIDCDLRRNSLRGLTGPTEFGLVEALSGEVSLDSVIRQDQSSNLFILPLSGKTFTAKDIFTGGAMAEMLTALRQTFDFIILDGPPVLAVTDALNLAVLADQVVLIARHRKTPREALAAAVQRLEGAPIVGVVISQVRSGSFAALGRKNPLYYHKTYSGYYVE